VFVRTMTCVIGPAENLAFGIGTNIDCGGVKTTTGNFGIAIITLGRLHSVLSCRSTPLEALSTPCG
jgi:hypothetical protein